VHPLEPTGAK
jgi:hypothetical protein